MKIIMSIFVLVLFKNIFSQNYILDSNYATEGTFTTPWQFPEYISLVDLRLNIERNLLITGVLDNSTNGTVDTYLIRLNNVGEFDNSFNNIGYAFLNIVDSSGFNGQLESKTEYVEDIINLKDGSVIITGHYNPEGYLFLAKYNSMGSIDETFGRNGILSIHADLWNAKILTLDDYFYVFAKQGGKTDQYSLFKISDIGEVDTTFGNNGQLTYTLPFWYITKAKVFLENKIYLLGYSTGDADIIIIRFNIDGSLDSSFGDNGVFTYDHYNLDDYAYDIIMSNDRNIFVTGEVDDGLDGHEKTIILKLNYNGNFDTSFNKKGFVVYNFSRNADKGLTIKLDENENVLLLIDAYFYSYLARFNSDGKIDSTFSDNGMLSLTDFHLTGNFSLVPISFAYDLNEDLYLGLWDFKNDKIVIKKYTCTQTTTFIKTNEITKDYSSLNQNYPNPFNPTTNIQFSIPEANYVSLKIYDLLGKEVAVLVDETKSGGTYTYKFDASNLSSGIYFYKLHVDDFVSFKKMMIIK